MAEYLWLIRGEVRSRTKVLDVCVAPESVEELPVLVIDARISDQSDEEAQEVVLRPRKIFKDPFRGGASILVLCDAFEQVGAFDMELSFGWRRVLCLETGPSIEVRVNPPFCHRSLWISGRPLALSPRPLLSWSLLPPIHACLART
jgi:hypothetical protein